MAAEAEAAAPRPLRRREPGVAGEAVRGGVGASRGRDRGGVAGEASVMAYGAAFKLKEPIRAWGGPRKLLACKWVGNIAGGGQMGYCDDSGVGTCPEIPPSSKKIDNKPYNLRNPASQIQNLIRVWGRGPAPKFSRF